MTTLIAPTTSLQDQAVLDEFFTPFARNFGLAETHSGTSLNCWDTDSYGDAWARQQTPKVGENETVSFAPAAVFHRSDLEALAETITTAGDIAALRNACLTLLGSEIDMTS